jgi:hypothetical protein
MRNFSFLKVFLNLWTTRDSTPLHLLSLLYTHYRSGYTCIMIYIENRQREPTEPSECTLTVKIYGILSMLLNSLGFCLSRSEQRRKMLHFRMLFKFIYIFFFICHSFWCIITFSLLNLLPFRAPFLVFENVFLPVSTPEKGLSFYGNEKVFLRDKFYGGIYAY